MPSLVFAFSGCCPWQNPLQGSMKSVSCVLVANLWSGRAYDVRYSWRCLL